MSYNSSKFKESVPNDDNIDINTNDYLNNNEDVKVEPVSLSNNDNPYTNKPKPNMNTQCVTATAVDNVIEGVIVADAYPAASSDEEIKNKYLAQGWDISELNNIPVATVEGSLEPQYFYNQEEMNILRQQPVPFSPCTTKITNCYSIPKPSTQQINKPQIILNPDDGACPVMVGAYSPAKVRFETLKQGICSRDTAVLKNRDEFLKFFNMYGLTRPKFFLSVEGWHTETYTTTSTDSNGKTTTKTHTRRVRDFYYEINLTNFLFPFGKITTINQNCTVEEMIDSYINDKNALKSLQLKKKINWNRAALCHLVHSYIRQLGWRRNLTVRTHVRNKSVRVATESKRARTWDNAFGRALMVVTVLPAIGFAIAGSGHRERGMRSVFTMQYGPLQVFEFIRGQLWCPMRRNVCSIS